MPAELPDFVIRPVIESDLPDLLDLWEALAAEGFIGAEAPIDRPARSAMWRERFIDSHDAVFLIARDDQNLLGVGSLEGRGGLLNLGLSVDGRFRQRGVATKLLDACLEWARNNGAHKISLQVWPHNEAAIALYEKFGFEHEGLLRKHYRRKNGELWDALVMGLPL